MKTCFVFTIIFLCLLPHFGYSFPGTATVELRDGSRKFLRDLQIGDEIRASPYHFEPVLNWLYYSPHEIRKYRVFSGDDFSLPISFGQYYVGLENTFFHTQRAPVFVSRNPFGYIHNLLFSLKDNDPIDDFDDRFRLTQVTINTVSSEIMKGVFIPYVENAKFMVNDISVYSYYDVLPDDINHLKFLEIMKTQPPQEIPGNSRVGENPAYRKFFYDLI